MQPIGRRRWAIAEGYIPSQSSFSDKALISHETACILNAGDQQAHVNITLFFAGREPVGPSDRCAAHVARFATCRNQPVVDDSIRGGLSAGTARLASRRIKRSIVVPLSQAFLPIEFMNRCSKMWNKS